MIFVRAHCEIQGREFSPSAATERTTLRFRRQVEPGEPVSRGPNRGRPSEYGYAQLSVLAPEIGPQPTSTPSTSARQSMPLEHPGDRGAILLSKLPSVVQSLRDLGAEHVTLFFDVSFVDQCNFELPPSVLRALAEADITVAFSCYEDDEDSEWVQPGVVHPVRR